MSFHIDDLLEIVDGLVRAGFQRVEQLDGVLDNAWPVKTRRIKAMLNAVAKHITERQATGKDSATFWANIEKIFSSAENLEPRVSRPNMLGPAKAVKAANMSSWSPETKRRKIEDTRLDVAIDSITGGRKSYISAARGFLCFMRDVHPHRIPLPAGVDDLILWSSFFKNGGTFSTYCAAIKWITECCGLPTDAFSDPMLRRAKTALKHITRPKEKRWIDGHLTQRLMKAAIADSNVKCAMLFCAAYVFMARVPSELLPWMADGKGLTERSRVLMSIAVQYDDCEMRVHLAKRKNARWGDTIRRSCACSLAPALCPVHVLAPWLDGFRRGEMPFKGISAAGATKKLREYLARCGIEDPGNYSLHSFRRGAAQDYVDFGCTLQQLLIAGGWCSRACFAYLKPEDLNVGAAAKFIIDDSDSDAD